MNELPFNEQFARVWADWLSYRKKRKLRNYAFPERVLKAIVRDSNNNEQIAIKMIEQSLDKEWQGIFPLKNQNNGQQADLRQQVQAEFVSRYKNWQ